MHFDEKLFSTNLDSETKNVQSHLDSFMTLMKTIQTIVVPVIALAIIGYQFFKKKKISL